MYGYVYITTNLKNHHKYIGQHKSTFFNPKYKGSGKILKDAFKKYNKESDWKVEMIEECNDADSLSLREEYWIAYYNAVDDELFYNVLKGGSKNSYIVTQKTKDKISASTKGTKYINNGIIEKRVKPEELDKYLSEGWHKGYIKRKSTYNKSSKSQKKRFEDPKERAKCASTKGTKAMFKDNITKYIKVDLVDKYLSEGWQLGNLSKRGRKQTQETKEKRRKTIIETYKNNKELRQRLSDIQKKLHEEHPEIFKHTQETKDKISKNTRVALSSSIKREKMSQAAKRRFNNSEERLKQSNRIKNYYKNLKKN